MYILYICSYVIHQHSCNIIIWDIKTSGQSELRLGATIKVKFPKININEKASECSTIQCTLYNWQI